MEFKAPEPVREIEPVRTVVLVKKVAPVRTVEPTNYERMRAHFIEIDDYWDRLDYQMELQIARLGLGRTEIAKTTRFDAGFNRGVEIAKAVLYWADKI